MTEPTADGGNEAQPPVEPTTPSLSPKPGALLIAVLLVALLFANLYADAQPGDYDGKYLTFGTIGLIAAVLGVDLNWFRRGKD